MGDARDRYRGPNRAGAIKSAVLHCPHGLPLQVAGSSSSSFRDLIYSYKLFEKHLRT